MDDDQLVAQLIAGDEPPLWLPQAIQRCRWSLQWAVSCEKEYPTRNKLRDQLNSLDAAISVVQESIGDLTLSNILLFGDAFFENQYEMVLGLESLAARVTASIADIRPGKGKDKFYIQPDGLSIQVHCALLLCLVWKRHKGELPRHNNKVAQEACAALWKAADGGTGGRWSANEGSVVVWRDHLKSAKEAANSAEWGHIESYVIGPGD